METAVWRIRDITALYVLVYLQYFLIYDLSSGSPEGRARHESHIQKEAEDNLKMKNKLATYQHAIALLISKGRRTDNFEHLVHVILPNPKYQVVDLPRPSQFSIISEIGY